MESGSKDGFVTMTPEEFEQLQKYAECTFFDKNIIGFLSMCTKLNLCGCKPRKITFATDRKQMNWCFNNF